MPILRNENLARCTNFRRDKKFQWDQPSGRAQTAAPARAARDPARRRYLLPLPTPAKARLTEEVVKKRYRHRFKRSVDLVEALKRRLA